MRIHPEGVQRSQRVGRVMCIEEGIGQKAGIKQQHLCCLTLSPFISVAGGSREVVTDL